MLVLVYNQDHSCPAKPPSPQMLVQPDVTMITGEKNDENLYICKIIHWTKLSVEHQLWPKQALGAAVSQKSHKITGEPSSAVVGKESLWKPKKQM